MGEGGSISELNDKKDSSRCSERRRPAEPERERSERSSSKRLTFLEQIEDDEEVAEDMLLRRPRLPDLLGVEAADSEDEHDILLLRLLRPE